MPRWRVRVWHVCTTLCRRCDRGAVWQSPFRPMFMPSSVARCRWTEVEALESSTFSECLCHYRCFGGCSQSRGCRAGWVGKPAAGTFPPTPRGHRLRMVGALAARAACRWRLRPCILRSLSFPRNRRNNALRLPYMVRWRHRGNGESRMSNPIDHLPKSAWRTKCCYKRLPTCIRPLCAFPWVGT